MVLGWKSILRRCSRMSRESMKLKMSMATSNSVVAVSIHQRLCFVVPLTGLI